MHIWLCVYWVKWFEKPIPYSRKLDLKWLTFHYLTLSKVLKILYPYFHNVQHHNLSRLKSNFTNRGCRCRSVFKHIINNYGHTGNIMIISGQCSKTKDFAHHFEDFMIFLEMTFIIMKPNNKKKKSQCSWSNSLLNRTCLMIKLAARRKTNYFQKHVQLHFFSFCCAKRCPRKIQIHCETNRK